MPTLLHVDCSPRGKMSVSRQLSHAFISQWKERHPTGQIIARDLAFQPVPFVDLAWIQGAFCPEEHRTAAQQTALRYSDEAISELLAAEEYLFSMPMYNFSVPAVFKAYIDQIVRVGKTIEITGLGSHGPMARGLLESKRAFFVLAEGGIYSSGSPFAGADYLAPYLRTVFNFIGIEDLEFICADGIALDASRLEERKRAALERIETLFQSCVSI